MKTFQERSKKQPSKKDQILALHNAGISDVAELAALAQSRPSYVAGVLQKVGALAGYFDLYTRTSRPMNIYAKYFGDLGFKDWPTAQKSVEHIDELYQQFEAVRDRAGQHHAMVVALTLFDRARWSGKDAEAGAFRDWLMAKIGDGARVMTAPQAAGAAKIDSTLAMH